VGSPFGVDGDHALRSEYSDMKHVLVQGDGMADRPIPELGGRTPLEAARTPNLDRMASRGILGMTPTIPEGMPPGSDVGTMSVLGYDPRLYHTGRSPIEAASMGVELSPEDVAFRCNLVSTEPSDSGEIMKDFTAGHISTDEAAQVIAALASSLGGDGIEFFPGVSYRHLIVWRRGRDEMRTKPPHDITGQPIADHVPAGDGAERLIDLMERSRDLLRDHPVNMRRREQGKHEVTQIWTWGQGRSRRIPTLKERFGIAGAVIAAVDLVNGLGVIAGLHRIHVPGATGYLDTDYRAKAEYGLRALGDHDFLMIHVEAPDEAGHMGDVAEKVKAIEAIDELVVGTLLEGLSQYGEWRLLVMPDHPTPCELKTHSSEAVPFTVFSSADLGKTKGQSRRYNESDARGHGIFIPEAHTLIERFLKR
jgi:2,3-bisphosphoglycerate-independent phosphoglycerate mutase